MKVLKYKSMKIKMLRSQFVKNSAATEISTSNNIVLRSYLGLIAPRFSDKFQNSPDAVNYELITNHATEIVLL